jgi:type II secretory pathway predicted ATPase ExeA
MYEKFYRLNRSPFSLLPDPSFMFLSRQHVMALTLLKYSLMSRHPFTVITGEVGAGKTTLINRLLNDMNKRFTVGVINFTDQRVLQLWPWILSAYGMSHANKSTVSMYDDFKAFLNAERYRKRTTVLIVDEAQNLGPKALENLRMLSNVNTTETMLQLILVGQPEFRETLKRPDFRQLNQRVSVFYRLNPLTEAETRSYVDHRLEVAGGRRGTFDAQAVAMIWKESGGIARNVNTLCDLALVYGFTNAKAIIDEEVVREMLADRREVAVQTELPAVRREGAGAAPLHVVRDQPVN